MQSTIKYASNLQWLVLYWIGCGKYGYLNKLMWLHDCCMPIHSAAADTDLQHIYNNPGHRSNQAPILRLLHQHGYSNNKFLSYSYLLCWCVSTHRESDLKGPRHTRLLRGAAHQPNIHYLPTVNICIPCQGCKCPKLTFAIKNFTDMYSIHVWCCIVWGKWEESKKSLGIKLRVSTLTPTTRQPPALTIHCRVVCFSCTPSSHSAYAFLSFTS